MRRKKERIPLSAEDQAFMSELYLHHRSMIYNVALRFSRDPQVAADLTQECVLALIKNISTVRSLECCKVNAYIVVVIRRLYINYTKKESKATLLPIDQPSIAAEVDRLTAENRILSEDTRLDAITILEQLSERDRSLLESYYLEGMTDSELAKLCDCKPNSIRSLLSRARKRAKLIGLTSKEGDENEHG